MLGILGGSIGKTVRYSSVAQDLDGIGDLDGRAVLLGLLESELLCGECLE